MDPIIFISAIAAFVILFVVERFWPLRKRVRSVLSRLLVNAIVTGLALTTAMLVVQPGVAWALEAEVSRIGLLKVLKLPEGLDLVVGFLLLDLTFYYWHRLNHQVGFLWRFHNIHHMDPDLDVSTAFRFHFGETALSALFRVAQISLLGVSPLVYIVYELAFLCNVMFHHSNVRLPHQIERWLNQFLVTPRMHGIHHSNIKDQANSNYGVVVPWWDMLHRSFRRDVRQRDIVMGVPAYSAPEDNQLGRLLITPFCRQRDYWQTSHQEETRSASE